MDHDKLLREIRRALEKVFGSRLAGVVLYGSEARGQAQPDSDIDLLVLLRGQPVEPDDSWACIRSLYPLVLECGRPIHAEPVAAEEFREGDFPLFVNARREGVRV